MRPAWRVGVLGVSALLSVACGSTAESNPGGTGAVAGDSVGASSSGAATADGGAAGAAHGGVGGEIPRWKTCAEATTPEECENALATGWPPCSWHDTYEVMLGDCELGRLVGGCYDMANDFIGCTSESACNPDYCPASGNEKWMYKEVAPGLYHVIPDNLYRWTFGFADLGFNKHCSHESADQELCGCLCFPPEEDSSSGR